MTAQEGSYVLALYVLGVGPLSRLLLALILNTGI